MQTVGAFLAAVAFVGTVFGIVNWYFSYAGSAKRRNSILFTLIAAIVFSTFLFGYLTSEVGNNASVTQNGSISTSQKSSTPTVGITPTTEATLTETPTPIPTNTPIPTPSPTPTPLPYSISKTGDVCQP